MAGCSRVDRLVKVLGGEENLPPKLHTASQTPTIKVTEPVETNGDSNVQAKQEKTEDEEQTSDNWWDAEPNSMPAQVSSDSTATPAPSPRYGPNGMPLCPMDPRRGQPAPFGLKFCPFVAVTKYCYKFVKRDLQQPLATAFFDAGKIWNREWDLYYIFSGHFYTGKPVLFITEDQFQGLLDDINNHFKDANLKITDSQREDGLVIDFDDIELTHLRPFFLGHSTSRDQIEDWQDRLPQPQSVSATMTSPHYKTFREKMELAQEISKSKSKAAKKARQEQHVLRRHDMVRSMKRTQQYLGMTPAPPPPQDPHAVLDSGEPLESLESELASLSLSAIDTTKVMPYDFNRDVIFIAFDVEAYERPPRQVTEIGVATLDTRDLKLLAPGTNGVDWQKAIRAHHLRVAEYKNLVNKDFVEGCPDKFEFGKSEFVSKDNLHAAIAACFKPPYSGPFGTKNEEEVRKVVLVGHDVGQDINYLRQIGVNVTNIGGIIDTVDTAEMYRVKNKDPNARSLGSILYEFDFTGWNLHNAGNDAVYTMWAMLAICVKNASERESEKAAVELEEALRVRKEMAVQQALEKVRDDTEGWELEEDGGVALEQEKPAFGPPRPGEKVFYTSGGAVLDV